MRRILTIAAVSIFSSMAVAQGNPPPAPAPPEQCQPYPECVLSSSTLVPAAPNTGIRTQKQPELKADNGLTVQGISPLDRSTFRVPSPSLR